MSVGFAADVRISCGGRGKGLQRTGKNLAAGAANLFYNIKLLLQWEVMEGTPNLLLSQLGVLTVAETVKVTLGRVVFQS